jgi:hypothetical protein
MPYSVSARFDNSQVDVMLHAKRCSFMFSLFRPGQMRHSPDVRVVSALPVLWRRRHTTFLGRRLATEINRRLARHCELRKPVHLLAIARTAVIFPPQGSDLAPPLSGHDEKLQDCAERIHTGIMAQASVIL